METITKPEIAPEILESIKTGTLEEKQVIVHCYLPASSFWGNLVRIWKSVVLEDVESGHKCTLVHAENISFFPVWTEVPPMKDYWFTLIFTGLPKECKSFTLNENVPQQGGFLVKNIPRNKTDVYRIKIY